MEEKASLEQLQILEQAAQNLLLQKQIFQMELAETSAALDSLKDVKGDVYKIVGSLMFKAEPGNLKKELENKLKLLDLRIKAIEKQEDDLSKKGLKLRGELLKKEK